MFIAKYRIYFHFLFLANEQESAIERWRPILGVESIIVSVISMLSDPNDDSPANLDAAVSYHTTSISLTIILYCYVLPIILHY
jgi:ubiquitin-protein ligase